MMRRSNREFNSSAIEQARQRQWNEAYSYHHDNARRWFLVAVGAVVVAGMATGRSWYFDNQPKRVPWLIDRNGPSVMTAQLVAQMPDAARVKGHLTTWVMGMRTVTSDILMQKHLVDQTYAGIDTGAIIKQQLDAWYIANNPYNRGKEKTVDVVVTTVIPQGGNSWLIDWTETAWVRDPTKQPVDTHWRMTVEIVIRLPETDDEFRTNWDGVFVQSMHLLSL